MTAAGEAYDSGRGGRLQGRERLVTPDGRLITAAGEAYESGRGADYKSGRSL